MKIRAFIVIILLSVLSINASVYKLPKTKIDGREYYYYEVQPKETIYSLSRTLELSQNEMIKYNPSLADGLKSGYTLYFPVDEINNVQEPYVHIVKRGETIYGISRMYDLTVEQLLQLNPGAEDGVKVGDKLVIIAPKDDLAEEVIDVINEDVAVENDDLGQVEFNTVSSEEDAYKIALLMPFMIEEEPMSYTTRTNLDFYKGFLLAVDSLNDVGEKIKIYAYDTHHSIDTINEILKTPEMKDVDVIITPPGEPKAIATIADFANLADVKIFNIFYANDTTQITHKNVIQCNISRDKMYEKVVDRLMAEYSDYVPVIIGSDVNQNRLPLVKSIKERYAELGVEPKTIMYKRIMSSTDLATLDSSEKYIFIPLSSSEQEFEKYIVALKAYKEDQKAEIALFGYPEWVSFKADKISLLHSVNAVVYSRFFFDENSKRGKRFADKFQQEFGTSMIMTPPIQAVLGFDCGYYLINALREGVGDLENSHSKYEGMQYGFDFDSLGVDSGVENNALFYIYYRPNGSIKRVMF